MSYPVIYFVLAKCPSEDANQKEQWPELPRPDFFFSTHSRKLDAVVDPSGWLGSALVGP